MNKFVVAVALVAAILLTSLAHGQVKAATWPTTDPDPLKIGGSLATPPLTSPVDPPQSGPLAISQLPVKTSAYQPTSQPAVVRNRIIRQTIVPAKSKPIGHKRLQQDIKGWNPASTSYVDAKIKAAAASTGGTTSGGGKTMHNNTGWDPFTTLIWIVVLLLIFSIAHWLWGNLVRNRSLRDENRDPAKEFDPHAEVPGWFRTHTSKHSSSLEAKGEKVMIAEAEGKAKAAQADADARRAEAEARAEAAHAAAMAAAARAQERQAALDALLTARTAPTPATPALAGGAPAMLVPVFGIPGNAANPPAAPAEKKAEPLRLTLDEFEKVKKMVEPTRQQGGNRGGGGGGGNNP